MMLFSQRSAEYASWKLGPSTIEKQGCVVMSLATLLQIHPSEILLVPRAFNSRGECDISVVCEFFGAKVVYRGKNPPRGWCMARTTYYKNVGVPSHYFPYNADTKQCIDPLQNPTSRQQNIYPITEYISVTNVKLDFTIEDLEKRLLIAGRAIPRLSGMRLNAVERFISRVKLLLSRL